MPTTVVATRVCSRKEGSEDHSSLEGFAQSWADGVVAAVIASDVPSLSVLARRALRNDPPPLDLWKSGAGYLVNEAHLWQNLPLAPANDRRLAAAKWRTAAKGFRKPKGIAQKPNPLPGGYRNFSASVDKLVIELSSMTENEHPHIVREAASVMVLSSFLHVEKLHLAEDSEFKVASKKPAVRALLRRLRRLAAELAEDRQERKRKTEHFTELAGKNAPPTTSAIDVATSCSRASTDAADQEIECALQEAGLLSAEQVAPISQIA